MEQSVSSKWLVLHLVFLVVLLLFRRDITKRLKQTENPDGSLASPYGWGILIALFLSSVGTLGLGRYLEGTEEFVRYQSMLIGIAFCLLLLFDLYSIFKHRKRKNLALRTYSELAVYDFLFIVGNLGIWLLLVNLKRN